LGNGDAADFLDAAQGFCSVAVVARGDDGDELAISVPGK